ETTQALPRHPAAADLRPRRAAGNHAAHRTRDCGCLPAGAVDIGGLAEATRSPFAVGGRWRSRTLPAFIHPRLPAGRRKIRKDARGARGRGKAPKVCSIGGSRPAFSISVAASQPPARARPPLFPRGALSV